MQRINKEGVKSFLAKNKVFRIFVVTILLYIIVSPFLPEINYQLRKLLNIQYEEEIYLEEEKRTELVQEEYDRGKLEGNFLVIPTIGVHINIVEGSKETVLFKGAWRRPNTSTPEKGGNTVITGHRYHYVPPNNKTFYNLNKLEIDSKIFVYWKKKEYAYKVYDTFIVEPHQIEIEENTDEDILTLYTCHPLWTSDKRYVVRAKLIGVKEYFIY
jgi:sortase A